MSEKIEDQVREFAGEAQQKYGEMTGDGCHQAKGAAQKMAAQGSQAIQDATDTVGEHVSNNPIMAVSIAASFGLLIGLLLGRK